jgi:hypothetical protein
LFETTTTKFQFQRRNADGMKTVLIVSESEDEPPTYSEAVEAAQQTYWWDEGREGEGASGSRDHSEPPPHFSTVIASQAL